MEEKTPRKASNKDRQNALMAKLEEWKAQGLSSEEAVGKLTPKQYDFLIDQGVDLDDWVLDPEHAHNVKKGVLPRERRKSPDGYNKKYPAAKMELYNQLVEFVEAQGGEVIPRSKQNYRDLDFTLAGTHYKLVLSNPRG